MKTQDPFKKAADELRKFFAESNNDKLKAGHAHELAAACFNYKTKASMKADRFQLYPEDPDSYDTAPIYVVENRLTALGLDSGVAPNIFKIVSAAVSPACDYCGSEGNSQPLYGQEKVEWICGRCIRSNPEDVGYCWCCGDEKLYTASALNKASECPEHAGESLPMNEEEAEDRASFIEYWQKHNPF